MAKFPALPKFGFIECPYNRCDCKFVSQVDFVRHLAYHDSPGYIGKYDWNHRQKRGRN